MSVTLLVALVLGLVIGALLGLLGGGGSILAVPALVYGVGQPLSAAVPTSLLVVGISSAAAVLPRLRQVQWRLAAIFGVTGAGAAFAGTAVNRLLHPSIILLGLAMVMVVAAVRMLLGLPMVTATATSLVVIVINSAAGFTAHLGDASLDLGIAAAFAGAA
ncbi:MAG TPA: TSUP family transporter, partial [Propionibacteriaceae bacterium]